MSHVLLFYGVSFHKFSWGSGVASVTILLAQLSCAVFSFVLSELKKKSCDTPQPEFSPIFSTTQTGMGTKGVLHMKGGPIRIFEHHHVLDCHTTKFRYAV